MKWVNIVLCLLSALLIIGADSIVKYESHKPYVQASVSPKMMACYAMYFVQIILALVLFKNGGEMAIYTNMFVVFYSILGVLSGLVLFHEALTTQQSIGVFLGVVAAVLMCK